MYQHVEVAQEKLPTESNQIAALFLFFVLSTMALWAFAFMRLPSVTPEWLLRAQYACFGSNEHGLPDSGGWLVLIGSPLLILAGLQCLYWGDILRSIQACFKRRAFRSLFLLTGVFLFFEIFWISGRLSESFAAQSVTYDFPSDSSLPQSYPKLMKPVPQFTLVNQEGLSRSAKDFSTPYFLTFAFAHCSTICPALVRNVEAASLALGNPEVKAVYITLDPWRDTPSALPTLAEKWKLLPGHQVLSGDPAAVNKVLDEFQIARQRDEKNGEVSHPALVYIVNHKGEIVYGMNNASIQWLSQGMQRVIKDYRSDG